MKKHYWPPSDIPPHEVHSCLKLMIPTVKFIANLHRQVIAHVGHYKKPGEIFNSARHKVFKIFCPLFLLHYSTDFSETLIISIASMIWASLITSGGAKRMM